MQKVIAQDNTVYTSHMLPSGSSTIGALMTMVTGMANSNLYLTTMPEALKEPYLTASAPQMKNLGYETSFGMLGQRLGKIFKNLLWHKVLINFIVEAILMKMLQVVCGALMMNIYMMLFLNKLMKIKLHLVLY